MKAMVLAAGIGTRLKPYTDGVPKALIEVGGVAMLEIVLRRLIKAGARGIIINVFHLADKIADFVKKRDFGVEIELSYEKELLDTGGGLKNVSLFFDDGKPFFLHNVDVFSNIDLKKMYGFHVENKALATLSVAERPSGRYFLFDPAGGLCGWESVKDKEKKWAGCAIERAERKAFNGIHVISPEIFQKMTETGIFSIKEAYLRLAGAGERILAFESGDYVWKDMGSIETLEQTRGFIKENKLTPPDFFQ